MHSFFGGPQVVALIIAIAMLGLGVAGVVWMARVIRGELGSSHARSGDPSGVVSPAALPAALMKDALARGLVTPQQLAAMAPAERTFFLASLKQKLAPVAPVSAPAAPPPVAAPAATAALPADVPPEMLAILNAEKLRVWCPMCGTELELPTFPPLLARCSTCGNKSAIREEEGGRYVVMVSPPTTLPRRSP